MKKQNFNLKYLVYFTSLLILGACGDGNQYVQVETAAAGNRDGVEITIKLDRLKNAADTSRIHRVTVESGGVEVLSIENPEGWIPVEEQYFTDVIHSDNISASNYYGLYATKYAELLVLQGEDQEQQPGLMTVIRVDGVPTELLNQKTRLMYALINKEETFFDFVGTERLTESEGAFEKYNPLIYYVYRDAVHVFDEAMSREINEDNGNFVYPYLGRSNPDQWMYRDAYTIAPVTAEEKATRTEWMEYIKSLGIDGNVAYINVQDKDYMFIAEKDSLAGMKTKLFTAKKPYEEPMNLPSLGSLLQKNIAPQSIVFLNTLNVEGNEIEMDITILNPLLGDGETQGVDMGGEMHHIASYIITDSGVNLKTN